MWDSIYPNESEDNNAKLPALSLTDVLSVELKCGAEVRALVRSSGSSEVPGTLHQAQRQPIWEVLVDIMLHTPAAPHSRL